ncbi:MAG: dihydroorotase [Gammaproteobacteria bacterium]|nr:dihydroorotase [Gammaproteobacteria bacterium]
MKIAILGGHLLDPANGVDGLLDLYVAEGKVVAVGAKPDGFVADQTINAKGRVVCPGLIDLQARLREPGQEVKGTIASETAAAAKGGITTVVCAPDTSPIVEGRAVVESILARAAQAGQARVHVVGALTLGLKGEQLAPMIGLKKAGCVAVSNGLKQVTNTEVMRRAMEYAASVDMPVMLFSEDPWLRGSGVAHEGSVSSRLGLTGIPVIAETIGVSRDLALIEQTGVRAHFLHISGDKAARKIARAKHDGLPVTASVTAHHLHMTEMDLGDFNVNAHVRPPLRSERDRDGLRQRLAEGVISAICSDHQPHDSDAKLAPFAETEPGISSLETLLPLSLRLVHEEVLSLSQMVAKLTAEPARILGLDSGHLAVGACADVCVFDPESYWTFDLAQLRSRGKNSPFLGWEFRGGQVHATLLAGNVVYQHSA